MPTETKIYPEDLILWTFKIHRENDFLKILLTDIVIYNNVNNFSLVLFLLFIHALFRNEILP